MRLLVVLSLLALTGCASSLKLEKTYLWKVEKDSTQAYLFGSVGGGVREHEFPEIAAKALADSVSVLHLQGAHEADVEDDGASYETMPADVPNIKNLVSAETWAKLLKFRGNITLESLNRAQPTLLAKYYERTIDLQRFYVSRIERELLETDNYTQYVVNRLAKKNGQKSSHSPQGSSPGVCVYKGDVRTLDRLVSENTQRGYITLETLHKYRAGNDAYFEDYYTLISGSKNCRASNLYDVWTTSLQLSSASGTVFAVAPLKTLLPKEGSLLEKLEKDGFTVRRIE
jgi:uncharacterized protein YbaP (TraB family)